MTRGGCAPAGSVVVAGAVARRIRYGGHVWALLHWVLGFRRMGWSVLFLDRVEGGTAALESRSVGLFVRTMERLGLGDAYSLEVGGGAAPAGLPRARVLERIREADFLLDIMGYLGDEALLAASRRRVFLDIDPGFGQMWRAEGLCDVFAGHDRFVTVGTNVGRPGCAIPTCGLRWIPTLPPVVLELWPAQRAPGSRFTSVGSWRGPFDAVSYQGRRFGLRAHEFRRFATVPRDAGLPFEVALDIDDADASDADRLREGGWRLADPRRVAEDPFGYQEYVSGSRAEFMVAKEMYVRSCSGWFSDRTACYLASGRPALVQDTGCEAIETGEGLVSFRTPEEAVDAARRVDADWRRHARAARELAEQHLDASRVLGRLAEAVAA